MSDSSSIVLNRTARVEVSHVNGSRHNAPIIWLECFATAPLNGNPFPQWSLGLSADQALLVGSALLRSAAAASADKTGYIAPRKSTVFLAGAC